MANRRQEILDKAREMFSRQSYHAVSLEKISQVLGMGKSTMYHYFPTKEKLFSEVLTENVQELYREVYAKVREGRGFQEKVFLLVKGVLQYFEEHRETFLLLMRERLDFLNLEQVKELQTTFRPEFDKFTEHFRVVVIEAIQSGEIINVEPTVILANIFGTITAASLSLIIHEPQRKLTEIVDDCYRVIIHGTAAPGHAHV